MDEGARRPFVDVALDLSAALVAEDRYRRLLAAIREALPVEGGMLLRRERDELYPVAALGLQARALALCFPVTEFAVAGDPFARQPKRTVGRVDLLERYTDVPEQDQPPGVMIGIPLVVEDAVVGALNVGSSDPHAFDHVPDADFEAYAALAAAALRTADLIDALEEQTRRERRVAQQLVRDAAARFDGSLVGSSAAARHVRSAIAGAGKLDTPLLITGPYGAGKEAVARSVHHGGDRKNNAFIVANCAFEQVEMRSLFSEKRLAGGLPSKLDLAKGGSLFLESVDMLANEPQQTLARYLDRDRERSVRVIMSISGIGAPEERLLPSLQEHVIKPLRVPALRERRADIIAIAEHYLAKHGSQSERIRLSETSRKQLTAYDWPGNIRELRNVLERAVATARGPMIDIDESVLARRATLGSYTLIKPLGSGGMGEVWLASHRHLSRPAAVKVIRRDQLTKMGDAQHLARRFQREAQATANLRSHHTVEIYDFGISDDGSFYYVMERLHGLDLDTIVERYGPLPPARVVFLLAQACRSLAEAHTAGLVHRDIKPANVFACSGPDYDFVKVLDFGLVTTLDERDVDVDAQTRSAVSLAPTMQDPSELRTLFSDSSLGTPAFMPPEAVAKTEIDGRSDIYSLGCVAYWLLTGHPPFMADDVMQLLIMHMNDAPAPMHMSRAQRYPIPPALEDLVQRCLSKQPSARPATATDVRRELLALELEHPWSDDHARNWWYKVAPQSVVTTSRQRDT